MKTALIVCAIGACAISAAGVAPYALECEALRNPVGVGAARPRLSWKLKSGQEGQRQSAYQVLAASSRESLAAGKGDLWDSGRVDSPETLWIPFGGAALHSFERVWWKVRAWDAAGQAGGWSDAAQFTMGLANPAEAKGGWISSPDHSLRSGPLPLFRKEFTLTKPLRRATIVVSGVGFHELHVNGVRIGDHVLAPAWSNYRATVYYETFDVTSALRMGPNVVGVLLGNGFYNVAGGRYVKYSGSFGHPRLLVQLRLEYADSTSADIVTDRTWKTHDGPITFSCIYGGEDYDARREMSGWDAPGFDDGAWDAASTNEAPGGALRAQTSPPVRVQHEYSPVKVTQPKPGTYVYDLGQNFSGWPAISVTGPAGARVKMTPGELLDESGLVSQRSSGGPTYFSYVLKGQGRERWAPRFSYYGFRYVQVEGAAPEGAAGGGPAVLHSLTGQFIHLDAPRIGRFESSSDLLNRIHALIDAAVRSNLQHVLTDCPHREKLGWLEQAHLMGPSLVYNWDLRTFLPKIARDMREAQTVDGLVPDIAPEYVVFGRGFRDSPEWGSAAALVPRMAFDWYGDRQTLQDAYPMMKSYVSYLGARAGDGILNYGLGDWYDIGPGAPGFSQLTPMGLTATAFYLEDLREAGRAAALLGLGGERAAFDARFTEMLGRFQKAFYRDGSYAGGSQTALAMPLAMNLAPAESRAALAGRLVDAIRSRDNHTSAGDIGYRYVIQALLEAGRNDVIFDLASQPTKPSYAGQLAAGATSLTEAWDANPNSSQNHLMLGHIEQWFYAGLAGIRPVADSPGLTKIRIWPAPVGDVRWVKASWDSVRGPVNVDWRISGGRFHLSVDIPPGMTADVRLPGQAAATKGSGHYELECAAPGS
ncbi:MAG: family 78 glycoside hydrolase catalytic domain [Acidobacteria bacterium]|nr:family 78 glycoside hydrolase catalytic domain [Acidobacteriota bacterium]